MNSPISNVLKSAHYTYLYLSSFIPWFIYVICSIPQFSLFSIPPITSLFNKSKRFIASYILSSLSTKKKILWTSPKKLLKNLKKLDLNFIISGCHAVILTCYTIIRLNLLRNNIAQSLYPLCLWYMPDWNKKLGKLDILYWLNPSIFFS